MEESAVWFFTALNIVAMCVSLAALFFVWLDRREEAEASRFSQNYQDAHERSKI